MDDAISRQAAIDAIKREKVKVFHELYDEAWNDAINGCMEVIGQLPPIQPEIVRCKDCKHWREGTAFSYCDKLYGMGVLDALDYMVAEDDYCSMAERREVNNESN